MSLRGLHKRLAALLAALPLLLTLETYALARPAGGGAPAVRVGEAPGPAPAPAPDLAPPRFGSRESVRLAAASLRGGGPSLPPMGRHPATAGEDSDSDPAADTALKLTIVYGAVSIGCLATAAAFIPTGAYYFFKAVAYDAAGGTPVFLPQMPLFFIGLGLLVPGFVFLSKGLDQLRLYRSLTAGLDPRGDGRMFAGLPLSPRDVYLAGDVVLFTF